MNLLKQYILSLPVEAGLTFGINDNVILKNIDISERLTRKGDISSKTFYMEFVKVDEDREELARNEFSFFKLNAEKIDFVEMNFNDQFNKLLNLSIVMYKNDEEALEKKLAEVNNDIFGSDEGLLELADDVFRFNSKTKSKQKVSAKQLKIAVEDLSDKLNKVFYEVLKDRTGKNSPLMYLLTVVDKAGYKQLPDEAVFVSLEEDELTIEAKYLSRKAAAEKPEVADEVGDEIDDEDLDALDDIGDVSDLDDLDDIGDLDEID